VLVDDLPRAFTLTAVELHASEYSPGVTVSLP
jgi:hypothetical protein